LCETGWPCTYLDRDVYLGEEELGSFLGQGSIEECFELRELKGLNAWQMLGGAEGTPSWHGRGLLLNLTVCAAVLCVVGYLAEWFEGRVLTARTVGPEVKRRRQIATSP
jgi:hypothetical protein